MICGLYKFHVLWTQYVYVVKTSGTVELLAKLDS